MLRHNLDVMHIEKNIMEILLGTLLNIEGKTKDSVKARLDLELMGIRQELHLQEELSDSEDELLKVLEGVVSSKQEVEALSQPKAAVSLVKPHSALETSPTPEPPDLLDPGVKGESALLYSNGDIVFNKHLSKSTKRRLRKQAKEASFSALSSGRN
ncbi:hypothetical protein RHSIM_Rhsim11G0000400 [Rhododendron simsii]|uniref:Uncharacterized protein n=1 Tax=Rhododendron simsii TaxID=118357 RepID=A0A834G7K5_RHOSS|nr:hypothetical protein RHSIM_Rhsim11G0000400 [Rhododendron simsii]